MNIELGDWLTVLIHFASMSLFMVGGAITLIPEFHRFFIDEHAWLTESQFSSGIALAQASPGPNALMLAMMGWNFGINATPTGSSHYLFAVMGFTMCLMGALTPSCILTYTTTRWVQKNSTKKGVIAFKQGLAPVVIGSMLVSSWVIVRGDFVLEHNWKIWGVALITLVMVWATKIHILWLLAFGAVIGASGLLGSF
jgi:chromate transporter